MLAAAALPQIASAQTIKEFKTPTTDSGPVNIARGPDGTQWFTETNANRVAHIFPGGGITEFPLPSGSSLPWDIVAGADGNVWYSRNGNINTSVKAKIGVVTTSGNATEFDLDTDSQVSVTRGPDGNVWFAEFDRSKVGFVTPAGAITMFPLNANSGPTDIALGPDGNLWVTLFNSNKIAVVDPDGTFTEFPITAASSGASGIIQGSDGALWFSERDANKIGRITTTGTVTEFSLPNSGSLPTGIADGPDGALWFVEFGANKIGRITTAGVVTEFAIPTSTAIPQGIVAGPDGNIYFTEQAQDKIGRMPLADGTSPLVSSVLPTSRSVQVGNTATVFAAMINSGSSALSNCKIAPVAPVSGTFLYQTTDPSTNKLTGTANTPVAIPAGGTQTFIIAIKANGSFPPTQTLFGYSCDNAAAASAISGVNTLQLVFDKNPVADMIAVGLTPSNDGFARTGGSSGTGVFAIATTNVGATATLTAKPRLSNTTMPVTATVCETDSSAHCKAPAAASVTRSFAQNETATFSVFLQASGAVAADPAVNRIFLEFLDAGNIVRGSTSTAVTTQ